MYHISGLSYYQKYLDRIDECLNVRNNPDKAKNVSTVLIEILNKYLDLQPGKYYFPAYFNQLLFLLREFSSKGNTEEMRKVADQYFGKLQQKNLISLSGMLDQLTKIIQTNKDEKYNCRLQDLISRINNNETLEDSDTVAYLKDAGELIHEFNYSNTASTTIIEETDPEDGSFLSFLKKFFE